MDKKAFFDNVRGPLFSGSIPATAVTTIEAIVDEAAKSNASITDLAYMLATAYHEVGRALVPIRENMNYTKADRIRATWPTRFPTNASAVPYVNHPQKLANKVYGGRLGNDTVNDGWLYRGGGLAQSTGKENYIKVKNYSGVDVVASPMLITRLDVSVIALVHFMLDGVYTGKKLSDYNGAAGFVQMRAIINADVKANGAKVAGYAKKFLSGLTAAGYDPKTSKSVAKPVPVLKPEVQEPVLADNKAPVAVTAGLVGIGVFYAAWDWIANIPCSLFSVMCGG